MRNQAWLPQYFNSMFVSHVFTIHKDMVYRTAMIWLVFIPKEWHMLTSVTSYSDAVLLSTYVSYLAYRVLQTCLPVS